MNLNYEICLTYTAGEADDEWYHDSPQFRVMPAGDAFQPADVRLSVGVLRTEMQ